MSRFLAVTSAAVALFSIQLIPVSTTNPPVTKDLSAPAQVGIVLQRDCYDCHSNRTRWPWYARVAPVSWLAAHDVNDGRRHLNFSNWDAYAADPGTAAEKLRKLGKVVAGASMPPWYYAMMHPQTRLTRDDRTLVAGWAAQQAAIEDRASAGISQ